MPLSKIVDNDALLSNYDKILADYKYFVEKDYFVDYTHDYDLCSLNFDNPQDLMNIQIPKKTGHFWQVVPLIVGRKVIPILPPDIKNCFTAKLLMSFKVKPVLTVFSMLKPNSDVPPHFDTDDEIVMNNRHIHYKQRKTSVVKYHYSLDIPPGDKCALSCGGKIRTLNNKDLNPFDETTIHSAYNHSNQNRGVLIVSYIRQEIYPEDI